MERFTRKPINPKMFAVFRSTV